MRKWLLLLLCVCCVFGTLTMVGCSKPAADDPGVEELPPEGQEKEAPGPPPDQREEPKAGEEG